MNIFYDGEIYAVYPKQSGGISRYFDNLIGRLPDDFYPSLTTGRDHQGSHPQHQNLKIYRYDIKFRPGRVNRWLRKHYFQFIANNIKPQIAHPTYYSLLTGKQVSEYKCPVVITVYDMIHEIFADLMDSNSQVAEIKKKAIFSAQAIICISESTKRDLLDRYPSLSDRITVTPLATELSEKIISKEFNVPSCPYYLYVGGRSGYKNFERLLVAFAKVITKFPDLLICVIGSSFNRDENKRIAELNLSNHIKHYGAVNDNQLAKLYNASVALVYPSLYEGFGIPPLEAMACGTAVIASNISSIPEVVGDAGLLFDPTSTDELVDHLLLLVESPSKREFLVHQGKQQVQKFSWDKTTAQTVDIYKTLT